MARRVEKQVQLGQRIWSGVIKRLHEQVERAERASAKRQRQAGARPWGYHHFDRVLAVKRRRGGRLDVLLRLHGGRDDKWVAFEQLRADVQREARLWEFTTYGRRAPYVGERPVGARTSSRFAARFKRLVRGVDRWRGLGRPSCVRVTTEAETVVDLGEAGERRGWKRTCLDALEEMDLVGDAWQTQQAERGRGVKMRRSRSPRAAT